MPKFTLSDAEFNRLLDAANTKAERDALAEMVKAANDVDQLLALDNWRKNSLKFIGPLDRLEIELGKLSANAGLLQSPDVKAVRQRLAALRKELGLEAADAEDDVDNEDAEADDVAAAAAGPMPASTTPKGGFEAFFATNLPNVAHFTAGEFLYKGGSHGANGLNTDPPKALWPNVLPLARLLNQFRTQIGAPVRLTSIYRSPLYNASVDGKPGSQHLEFKAADFVVAGAGNPADWAKALREMRGAGAFAGGIGTYNSFVHVDVRGANADW